jgi:histidine triad (HIT) family protein
MSVCIFCRIVEGEIESKIAYQDELVVAFHDANPMAPVHVLIVPREHIESLLALREDHSKLMGHMLLVTAKVARELGVAETGFRLVTNTNRDAGQFVPHLHWHLLGGRALDWPPG